jgi:hypothetical protein
MEGSLVAYKVFTNGSVLNASEVNDNLMNQAVITFTNSTARASAITSAVEGMVTYLADTDTYQFWNGSAWTNLVSSTVGTGNAIINGGFEIWQRGTTFSSLTGGGQDNFLADRFNLAFDGSGATRSVTRENFTPGTAPVAGYESAFFLRYARTVAGSGATFDRITQRIEDVRTFAGQSVTVSFWAKVATGTPTLTIRARQSFGSGGSSDVDLDSSVTLSTSWTRYTVTFSLAGLTGKTIGAGSYLEIHFRTALNTIQTIDLWGIQAEAGTSATPFRRNANSLQGELAACQRYYVRYTGAAYNNVAGRGNGKSTTQANIYVQHPVTMRVGALAIDYSNLAVWDEATAPSVTSAVLDVNNTQTAVVTMTVSSGLTQFRNYACVASSVGTGFIGFSAEL